MRPFAPNGDAGANRYYTQGYLNAGRTPLPQAGFVGDREDAGDPTEIMDTPDDEASDNDEVGENVDEPTVRPVPNRSGGIVDPPQPVDGPRALPGDRAYLRVFVPVANAG